MRKLKDHLFVSDTDGCLYDTRDPMWSKLPPLRKNYRKYHRDIKSIADVKAALRIGEYAWPGGYQMYFICADGEALSYKAARENFYEVLCGFKYKDPDWRIVASDINYEDKHLYCSHTGEKIPAAYVSDDDEDTSIELPDETRT